LVRDCALANNGAVDIHINVQMLTQFSLRMQLCYYVRMFD